VKVFDTRKTTEVLYSNKVHHSAVKALSWNHLNVIAAGSDDTTVSIFSQDLKVQG
jgi:hypothetical protein